METPTKTKTKNKTKQQHAVEVSRVFRMLKLDMYEREEGRRNQLTKIPLQ